MNTKRTNWYHDANVKIPFEEGKFVMAVAETCGEAYYMITGPTSKDRTTFVRGKNGGLLRSSSVKETTIHSPCHGEQRKNEVYDRTPSQMGNLLQLHIPDHMLNALMGAFDIDPENLEDVESFIEQACEKQNI